MAAPIRITGIVKLADTISRELSRPISTDRREALRNVVAARLRQIESLLTQHGVRDVQLPTRSQRSLAMLRSIDWTQISIARDARAARKGTERPKTIPNPNRGARPGDHKPSPGLFSEPQGPASASSQGKTPARSSASPTGTARYSAPALSRRVEQALRLLSESVTEVQSDSVRLMLEKASREIESAVRRQSITSQQMSDSFRANRAWVAMMAQSGRIAQYRRAQQWIISALLRVDGKRRLTQPIKIEFRPMRGLYKFRITARGTTVMLPTPMLGFDAAMFDALARMMLRRTSEARQQVLEAVDKGGYQSMRVELETLGGAAGVEPGAHHDLIASFERVNAAFFNNQMARPRLIWSRSITHRQMGYYQRASDTLMISRSLDRPDVELFVLDFLMYHELLHKKHGTRWSQGRGYVHTAEFYADEHRFPKHQEADDRLSSLAMEAASAR